MLLECLLRRTKPRAGQKGCNFPPESFCGQRIVFDDNAASFYLLSAFLGVEPAA
jgi:hypothetical protein